MTFYLVLTEEYYGGMGDRHPQIFITREEAEAHKAAIEKDHNLDVVINELHPFKKVQVKDSDNTHYLIGLDGMGDNAVITNSDFNNLDNVAIADLEE